MLSGILGLPACLWLDVCCCVGKFLLVTLSLALLFHRRFCCNGLISFKITFPLQMPHRSQTFTHF